MKDIVNILIIMKKARLKQAESYTMNRNMWIEADLVRAEIKALEEMTMADLNNIKP